MTFSLFGWNLFGNVGASGQPDPNDYLDNPNEYYKDYSRWVQMENVKARKENSYARLRAAGKNFAPAFTTSMGTREAPPNMMTSLFPRKMAPVDILSPEIASIDDLYRKRQNMFRYS